MNSPHADTDSHVIALIRSRQIVQADPQNATAHFEEGIALCQLGQSEEAIAAWMQAATLEPANAFAYINIGIVNLQMEQWHEAEQAFRHAVERQPERAEAHYGLGMAYARQGRLEAAQSAWQETLRLAPGHAEARANLAALMEMPAPQEVFSINLGPAQTLQMECAASPQLLAEKPQLSAEKPRIKLPDLNGPPLESIANTVLAAHEARVLAASLPNGETLPNGQTASVASRQEQDTPEPTLKFDSEDLKKEHARLRRRQGAMPAASSSRRNMVVAGSAAFVIILLTCWNLQSRRSQSVPPSSSLSPVASLARASTNLAAPYSEQPSSVLQHAVVAVKPSKPVLLTSTVARPPRINSHRRPAAQEPHPRGEHHADAEAVAPRPAHRRLSLPSRPIRAATVHPAKNRHDEDTFPVHAQAAHNAAADEWTDHIPR